MIVSFSNVLMLCPKQQPNKAQNTSPLPVLGSRFSHIETFRCSNKASSFRVNYRVNSSSSEERINSVANYDGLWEDPDDLSDDSDFEDEDSEEEMEENDLDYESDWEQGKKAEMVVTNTEELARRKYDEELIEEVGQMLSPEERAILEQNKAPNLDKISTAKWKPLHTFSLAGQIKFMDGMLENGYDIELVNKDGLTALHQAVIGKRESVISHLLRKGANPEAKDLDGATPLHYAAQVGALQTVKLLIKYRVDVNVADSEGWTPLHVALQTRNRDIVKVLLVNGADKTKKNKDGKTPSDLSFCYGKDFKSYELAKLLRQVSADNRSY